MKNLILALLMCQTFRSYRNLGFGALACVMPFFLYSDPCPDDNTPPVITSNGVTWDCSINIFEDPDSLFITVTEESECGLRVVEIARWDIEKGDCSENFIKRYTIIWYAEDMAGNVSNFTQEITIPRPEIGAIQFPQDTMVQCPSSGYDDSGLFGYPSINGNNLTDMCGFRVKYRLLDTLPTMRPEGCLTEVRKEWTVIDACTGTTRKDTQDIILIDTIRPIIACSSLEDTVTLTIDEASCAASYAFPQVGAIDFCAPDEDLVFRYLIENNVVGSEVSLMAGVYKGSVVVTDPCNNSDTCYYTIQVLDVSPPQISCPGTGIVLTDASQTVQVEDLNIIVSECTGDVDLVYRFSSQAEGEEAQGQTFTCDMVTNSPIGIVVIATDTSGNVSDPLLCDIPVSADGDFCVVRRIAGTTSTSSTQIQDTREVKAYYTGSALAVESQDGIHGLTLFNLSGHMVWQKQWKEAKYEYQSSLPGFVQNGLYILKISNGNGEFKNVKLTIF